EHVEEAVFTSENDRGAEHRPVKVGCAHQRFSGAFRALVAARAVDIRAQRAHVNVAAHAGLLAGRDDLAREGHVRLFEAARAAAIVQDADQVDDGIHAAREPREGRWIVHVGGNHIDGRQEDQRLGALAIARRHRHEIASRAQRLDDMTADIPAAAYHAYPRQFHIYRRPLLRAAFPAYSCPPGSSNAFSIARERGAITPMRSLSDSSACPNCWL